jgi:hypothetical protein
MALASSSPNSAVKDVTAASTSLYREGENSFVKVGDHKKRDFELIVHAER